MTDCRIVFNEQTASYRVETRRWWGWGFVKDASGEHYLAFDSLKEAQCFVCRRLRREQESHRRWKVVDLCDQHCPSY